ncbi:MAG: hypothetical protein KAR00_00100 [Candidatus Pacebacteria bacterium]|nr:hypothetical protein [Candidatus Paceibacterota bacterium]
MLAWRIEKRSHPELVEGGELGEEVLNDPPTGGEIRNLTPILPTRTENINIKSLRLGRRDFIFFSREKIIPTSKRCRGKVLLLHGSRVMSEQKTLFILLRL